MSGYLPLNTSFTAFQKKFTAEQNLREGIRIACIDLDMCAAQLRTSLYVLHHERADYPRELRDLRLLVENSKKAYENLKEVVPLTEYYKYHNCWNTFTQAHCTHIALIIWMETNTLASPELVAETLGLSMKPEQGFHLDINYYLLGLLDMCAELACVAETSKKYKRYTWPLQILKIVREVDAGFRMLVLNSYLLQQGYKAFQINIKKIEDIVDKISKSGELPKPESEEPKVEGPIWHLCMNKPNK